VKETCDLWVSDTNENTSVAILVNNKLNIVYQYIFHSRNKNHELKSIISKM